MKRDTGIECVAGLMICVMILHHMAFVPFVKVTDHLFMFFMAWFFFKSGMFHNCERLFQEELKRSVLKLFVPYIVFHVISISLYIVLEYVASSYVNVIGDIKGSIMQILRTGSVLYNGTLWFLLSLFIVKIVTNIIFINDKVITATIALSFLLSYVCSVQTQFNIPWYISNSALGIVFYGLGYLLKGVQYKKLIGYVSCIIYISTLFLFPLHFDFWSNSANHYLTTIPILLCGCIAINNCFRLFPRMQCAFLSYIGRNSMPIYTAHGILLYIISFLSHHYLDLDKGYPLFFGTLFILTIILFFYVTIYNHYKLQR